MDSTTPTNPGSSFDRAIGSLDGLPGVSSTRPTTVRSTTTLIGSAQTFIIQTYRQREEPAGDSQPSRSQDYVFIEYIGAEGSLRLVLPPEAALTIARQRQALTDRARSRSAKASAADRKRRGIKPAGFMTRRKAADR